MLEHVDASSQAEQLLQGVKEAREERGKESTYR